MPHKFHIVLNAVGRGRVEIDGKPMRGVVGISLDADAGSMPTVVLKFFAGDVDLEVHGDVTTTVEPQTHPK